MEGARLGWVGHVIVRDQLRCISELRGKDPGGLLVGTSILGPADEIQQLAVTVALIDLRVEDLGISNSSSPSMKTGRGGGCTWSGIVFRVAGSSIKTWNTGWTVRRLSGSRSITEWVPGCAITS